MKRTLKCILCFTAALIFLMLGVNASALSVGGEYLITQNGGNYTLSKYQNGIPEKLSTYSDLGTALSLCEGGIVALDNITAEEMLEINASSLIISGTLTSKDKIVIPAGTAVTFDNLKLNAHSYIRIKGGSLTVKGAEIASSSTAVLMDYSSLSAFNMTSGKITSTYTSAALSLISGNAEISGGEVISTGSAAIESSATLTLSGTPKISGIGYDIITSSPISLSHTENPFSGRISLMWQGSFTRGNMYEIFRNTSSDSLQDIMLYDALGKEYKITHHESSKHTDDLNFGAVYLPFEYSYYDGSNKLFSELYLDGEIPKAASAPSKTGYSFAGWYRDEGKTEEFSFADKVAADTEIFASYKLSSPVFTLSSLSFVYDGEQRLFGFDKLEHPLSNEGFYTLEWYKNGEYMGSFESVSIKNASDSGKYCCKITFRHSKDSISLMTPEVSVSVEKREVLIPKPEPKPYNGKLQYSDIHSTSLYTVTDNGGVTVGNYYVRLTLKDPDNYVFEGGKEGFTDVTFSVTKCQNSWTSMPEIKNFYQNSAAEHSAHSTYGEAYFLYSQTADGAYTENVPTLPGDYFCIAKADGTENYYELASEPIAFSILAEIPLGITLNTPPEKTDYIAFDKLSAAGLTLNVIYNSGRAETVGADSLGIKYQSGDCFMYGDNAVIISYLALELSMPITVEKRAYDISQIYFESKEVVYNGKYQALAISGVLPTGLDGIPLRAEVSSGAVNAGEYTVTLSFKTDSRNYILPDNKTAILKILPFSVDVIWGSTAFVYDGTPKCPTAHYVSTEGVKIPLSVSGAQVGARDNIIATASAPNGNYILKNPNKGFEILKADISFEGVTWSSSTFPYNNETRTVTVSGLPEGISVIGYTDNTAKDAGSYTATAILSYDEQNYNAPPPLKHTWTITKLDYDMSVFKFSDASFVYDGNAHYPILSGSLPTGLDGIPLTYSFSMGLTDVTDGDVSVGIAFSTDSKNYNCPAEIYARVKITPMPITVEWSYLPSVYDGLPHSPSASSAHTKINVSGAQVDAGKYVAKAVSVSQNYTLTNPEYSFEISKAPNSWLKEPTIADFYASVSPAPDARAKAGTPIFKYYKDKECTEEVKLPLCAGIYFMRTEVAESKNYFYLTSEPVSFEVMAVIPESLSITLKKENFVAFEVLDDSAIQVKVKFNDGTENIIPVSSLKITYQNADSLRASDTSFTVEYEALKESAGITVGKARYDLSAVVWQNIKHTYNAENKIPTLSGLPNGVCVLEYIGYGKNAGTYSVSARLGYDDANYEQPTVAPASVIIEKCIIKPPVLSSIEYDGEKKLALLDEKLYKTDFRGAVNVGTYSVAITLVDTENYVFEGGGTSAATELLIIPKPVNVNIPEVNVYLWQTPAMPNIEILSGLIGEDEVKFTFETSGDTMIIKSLNPNYTVKENSILINRINRPSPAILSAIIMSLVFIILLILVLAALYLNKEKIKDKIAIRKCRQSFAKEAEIKKIDEMVKAEELSDKTVFSVNVERADSLISDSLAKGLIKKEHDVIYTVGRRKCVINIDTVSDNFLVGEVVDVNTLKEKGLIPVDCGNIKILARGSIDKPLTVKANAFSLSAVKMIALSGGVAIKAVTQRNGN